MSSPRCAAARRATSPAATVPKTDTTRAGSGLGRRLAAVCLIALATVAALPGIAQAHVTVQPEQVEGGGFSVVAFRVPNERDQASTDRVRVLLPEDQPVGSVRTTPVPGWKVAVRERTLGEPIEMFGEQVDSVVSEITWTATGAGIGPGEFEDFEVSLGPLPKSGEMVFRALQRYTNGEQVNWNQVAVDDSVEPERPAPVLTLTAPATPAESSGSAGVDDGAAKTTPAAEGADADSAADRNGTLPLVLSSGALLASVVALFLVLRRRT